MIDSAFEHKSALQAWRYLVARSDKSGISPRGGIEADDLKELEHMTLLIHVDDVSVWLNPTHASGDPTTWVERVSTWDEAFVAKARKELHRKNCWKT